MIQLLVVLLAGVATGEMLVTEWGRDYCTWPSLKDGYKCDKEFDFTCLHLPSFESCMRIRYEIRTMAYHRPFEFACHIHDQEHVLCPMALYDESACKVNFSFTPDRHLDSDVSCTLRVIDGEYTCINWVVAEYDFCFEPFDAPHSMFPITRQFQRYYPIDIDNVAVIQKDFDENPHHYAHYRPTTAHPRVAPRGGSTRPKVMISNHLHPRAESAKPVKDPNRPYYTQVEHSHPYDDPEARRTKGYSDNYARPVGIESIWPEAIDSGETSDSSESSDIPDAPGRHVKPEAVTDRSQLIDEVHPDVVPALAHFTIPTEHVQVHVTRSHNDTMITHTHAFPPWSADHLPEHHYPGYTYIRSYNEHVAPVMKIHPNQRAYYKDYSFTDTYNIQHLSNRLHHPSEFQYHNQHATYLTKVKKEKAAQLMAEMSEQYDEDRRNGLY
jgi:hypothetical protein